MILQEDFTRINNNVHGNPRYVCHFLKLNTPTELSAEPWVDISEKYHLALARSRKIGGRKFHNKQYGGGIVFSCVYNLPQLCDLINKLTNQAQGETA